MKKLLILALALLSAVALQARTVKGYVYDKDRIPLIGVVVMCGPDNGTMTGADGSFSIPVPDNETVTLEFSYLGYIPVQLEVPPTQGVVEVVMEEDSMVLEETVVIGYGTTKKVNLTGAVTAVSSKELEKRTT